MGSEFMEFMKTASFIESIKEEVIGMDDVAFKSMVCMLIDEWTRANDQDSIETVDDIATAVHEVNTVFGKY